MICIELYKKIKIIKNDLFERYSSRVKKKCLDVTRDRNVFKIQFLACINNGQINHDWFEQFFDLLFSDEVQI